MMQYNGSKVIESEGKKNDRIRVATNRPRRRS